MTSMIATARRRRAGMPPGRHCPHAEEEVRADKHLGEPRTRIDVEEGAVVNVAHGCALRRIGARIDRKGGYAVIQKAQHVELRVVETLRVIAASQHEDDEQADRERRGDGGARRPTAGA